MTRIKETSNYDLFELHNLNRNYKENKVLERSMLEFGFHGAFPIYVVKNGHGKLKIKAGHHRFKTAMKLNLPIKYVLEEDNLSIHNIEKSTKNWTLEDYLISHISDGKHAYTVVKKYRETTGIGLRNSIALLGGISAGSNNFLDDFKSGTYELGDPGHSIIVADIVIHCQKCGISFVTITAFVNAISKVAMVEELDIELLKKKISKYPHLIKRQASLTDYVNMIEQIYNYNSHLKIPLSFFADDQAKKRQIKGISRNKNNSAKNRKYRSKT